MQITLNDSLTPTNVEPQRDISQELKTALNKKVWKDNHFGDSYFEFEAIDTIPKSILDNTGFVGLLSKAYSSHLKVAIAPQDIWIVLLSEVAKEVNADPEKYRHLFTESDDKQEISVPSGSLTHMPMDTLVSELANRVKFDSVVLFPQFSTNTPEATGVVQAIFCDMASPFYNYSMYLCGIPAIKLLGTQADWELLLSAWNNFGNLFDTSNIKDYVKTSSIILQQIIATFEHPTQNADFWKDIFTQKNVGSGGDLIIDGWILKLFMSEREVNKIQNFNCTYGILRYKQLQTGKEYFCIHGGFTTEKDSEDFYQLQYGSVVFEIIKTPKRR